MKLKKEIILIIGISIFIIFLELITNFITEESTKFIEEEIKEINFALSNIKGMNKEGQEYKEFKNYVEKRIEKLKEEWSINQDKLSYFSEHDELEKVSKCLITLEENVKNEEYENALEDGSEFIYWLNHTKEKDKLELKNIF